MMAERTAQVVGSKLPVRGGVSRVSSTFVAANPKADTKRRSSP